MTLLASIYFAVMGMAFVSCLSLWRFVGVGDAFRCRVRALDGPPSGWPRLTSRWSRRLWATWDDGEFVVRRGPLIGRRVRFAARVGPEGVYDVRPWDVPGCGGLPVAVVLSADGVRLEVVVRHRDRTVLVGPYLAAAVHDLTRRRLPDQGQPEQGW